MSTPQKKSSANVDALERLMAEHRTLIESYRNTARFIGPRLDGQPGQMEHLLKVADELEGLL